VIRLKVAPLESARKTDSGILFGVLTYRYYTGSDIGVESDLFWGMLE
jgi:hypothetical protein